MVFSSLKVPKSIPLKTLKDTVIASNSEYNIHFIIAINACIMDENEIREMKYSLGQGHTALTKALVGEPSEGCLFRFSSVCGAKKLVHPFKKMV